MKSRLENDLNKAIIKFPKLKLLKELKYGHCLYGCIDITNDQGELYESFKVKILFPAKYPFLFPRLIDIGNRIPHCKERHISKSGVCCVCSKREEDVRQQKSIRALEFLDEYVIPFYANQLYFEQEGKWVNGDFKHFDDGILQDYQELTDLTCPEDIIKLITLAREGKIGRNESCPCGSKLKYKRCHMAIFDEVKKLSTQRVNEDIEILKSFPPVRSLEQGLV